LVIIFITTYFAKSIGYHYKNSFSSISMQDSGYNITGIIALQEIWLFYCESKRLTLRYAGVIFYTQVLHVETFADKHRLRNSTFRSLALICPISDIC